jgi:hypothetical protein
MFAVPMTGGVVCAHFGLAARPRCRRMIFAAETTHSNREGKLVQPLGAALNAFNITFDGRISAGRR